MIHQNTIALTIEKLKELHSAGIQIVMIIGYVILQGVDDKPREWPPELQADYEPEHPRGAIGRSR